MRGHDQYNPHKTLERVKRMTESNSTTMKPIEELKGYTFVIPSYQRGVISKQITDMPWFKGSMDSDPTVKSMLVMLDCIHSHFGDREDFSDIAKLLCDDNCPIRFYCLNLGDELGGSQGIQNLYIKMNARGVPLTPFDIFKAQLQKEQPEGRLDLLKMLNENIDTKERIAQIGKINNE